MMPARLTSYPFPPYSYVTGLFPHPLRDSDGHGCPGPDASHTAPSTDDWQACEAYLWGIDLFNGGFYWEAHESWEAVWHAVGREGVVADWCKGLIKLAAAGVKAREGRDEGVRRHAKRAGELFTEVQAQIATDLFWGLSTQALLRQAASLERDAAAIARASADAPARATLPPLQVVGPHAGG